ncbi:RDD family protein [Aeromonas enteropelogenes]|uniref:RDD family protein n=1 Tax=Aeromonas enteropelogenes TaxID=29489 RepID=UPI003B9F1463
MKWWFEHNQTCYGPVEKDAIQQMISNGEIQRDTLVWCESMINRLPAFSVKEFWLPPSSSNNEKIQNNNALKIIPCSFPWRRIVARLFDIFLFFTIFIIALKHSIGLHQNDFLKIFLLFTFLFITFESVSTYLFETTLGKILLGIRVTGFNKKKVTFYDAFKRSLYVLILNAFFITPVISTLSQYYQYQYFKVNGHALHDKNTFEITISEPNYIYFITTFVILLLALFIVIF